MGCKTGRPYDMGCKADRPYNMGCKADHPYNMGCKVVRPYNPVIRRQHLIRFIYSKIRINSLSIKFVRKVIFLTLLTLQPLRRVSRLRMRRLTARILRARYLTASSIGLTIDGLLRVVPIDIFLTIAIVRADFL